MTKLRTLYDATSDAVLLLDGQTILGCNQAAPAVFGFATRAELCGLHPRGTCPRPCQPDGSPSAALATRHMAAALARGSLRFEWLHRRRDSGDLFPAEVLLDAMELDGKLVVQALVRDITERKRAEERLAEQHRLLQTILDTTPGFLMLKDRDGVYREANPAFCRVLGRTRETVIGRTDLDLFPPAEAAAHRAGETEVIADRQP